MTLSLASRMITFEPGLWVLKYQAIWLARSYGPGGQRYGAFGMDST
ncbi:MAG: hypothetical protein AW07_03592 [Candidatus Accumulibacter sp. SK-11]|nr:MAG: hypothetical protein AW07_03592 [Candidatus Accumulibacter sp. SK-11]